MIRFVIIGVVLAVAFTLFTIVDAAMTDAGRARGVGKPVWVLLTVVLPIIGGILWLTVGKGSDSPKTAGVAPDDDPLFKEMTRREMDRRIADLEEQLQALDDEVYPGEDNPTKKDDSEEPDTDGTQDKK